MDVAENKAVNLCWLQNCIPVQNTQGYPTQMMCPIKIKLQLALPFHCSRLCRYFKNRKKTLYLFMLTETRIIFDILFLFILGIPVKLRSVIQKHTKDTIEKFNLCVLWYCKLKRRSLFVSF